METQKSVLPLNLAVFFMFTFILYFSFISATAGSTGLQTYIVHVAQPAKSTIFASEERNGYYKSFLPFHTASTETHDRMVHSYNSVLSGFAMRLTQEEAKAMEKLDGFISARPERKFRLHTTHTPNFLGLHSEMGFWKDSNFGKGMIIGMLDTGVFPSHPSFSDEGMPLPPSKWKGRCELNVTDCNNKLIGARNLVTGNTTEHSPVDSDGHGSHTASTAAGAFVKNAAVLENAYGTSAGMAPMAHLAIYKVCSVEDCLEGDVLAGLDHAVEDGVDVISISLGIAETGSPFYMDNVAIGAFRAIQNGVFVSCSAGNSGPSNSTLFNDAPWILTVGASTMDRSIRAVAKLGNGDEFNGESLFQPKDFSSTLLPLVYAGANGKAESALCANGSLNGMEVKGKIVLCERGGGIARIDKGAEVKRAGGAGMIFMNEEVNGFSTEADPHVLPATHISFAAGLSVKAYINSSVTPMATIVFKGTVIGSAASPAVTSFSSRGPSVASPGILKPDIIGPGVSVLAAWPFPLDNTTSSNATFNILSGTSMSCPHLAGIAALIKSSHPDWSPAAVKSAIMTTTDLLNLEGKPILDQRFEPADFFATGSGHVNPSRANNPGLVYDIQPTDYIPYLCGLGYTDAQVGILAHQTIKCADETIISEGDLNYPSISAKLGPPQIFNRTLTNVGDAHSSYKVQIFAPKGVDVRVEPEELYFSEMTQKLTYSVTLILDGSDVRTPFSSGFLKWESPKYFVRSPISVTFV